MAASVSALAKMGMGAADPVTQAIEFLNEGLQKRGQIVETAGIRGTRSHPKERTREGTFTIDGQISMNPCPDELDFLLPYIVGGSESSDDFPLAETLPEMYISVDRIAKVFTYAGCKVNKATFRGREGQLLELSLEIMGKTEAVANSGTFPALTLTTAPPYIFHDCVMTIEATAYQIFDWEIVIDNKLNGQRFTNSQSRTDIPAMDREVTVTVTVPYTSTEADLHDKASHKTGVAATCVFTNGARSLTFTTPALQKASESPTVPSRDQEIRLRLGFTARSSGGTAELTINNDPTA